MKFRKALLAASVGLAFSAAQNASAHTAFVVDATSIPFAGKSYTGTMRAGHGCEDEITGDHFDTERIEITIPAGVTGVKPIDAPWAKASVVSHVEVVDGKDVTVVDKLIWTRYASIPVNTEDTNIYLVSFRATLPNAPLTSVSFDTVQFCHNAGAEEIETPWVGAESPTLNLVPSRSPGWNKYTIGTAISDEAGLKKFFGDAYIVWSGGAAYSPNSVTAGLITNKLTSVPANQEIWVKY